MPAIALVKNTRTVGKLAQETTGGFHELLNGADLTVSGNSGWLDKGMVPECQADLRLGVVTGTTPTMNLQIETADTAAGANTRVIGRFAQVADNDNTQAKLELPRIDQRFVRAIYVITGTTPVFPVRLTLRPCKTQYNVAHSAQVS